MSEKYYVENYAYQPTHCLKQVTNDTQTYYSYSNFPNLNNTQSTTNFMEVCNNSSFQHSTSSSCVQQEPPDLLNWDGKLIPDVEKTIKIAEKIDIIEISSKDLSPASYCSNIDLMIADSYKQNTSKETFNKIDDWCYNQSSCGQQNLGFASCLQENNKHYCPPKSRDVNFMTRNLNCNEMFQESTYRSNNKNLPNDASIYMYNYHNKFIRNEHFPQNDQYFNTNTFEPIINSIDQQTDCSNDESDIIVEESDEEVFECNEDLVKQFPGKTNKCLICDVLYEPLGTQFYLLTTENPLTMSSQKPVIKKLEDIIGKITTITNYICSECLGLINNVDHLQLKLEKFKFDLITKFQKTCLDNNVQHKKILFHQRKKVCIDKFPKYKCKLCKKVLCLKRYCLYHLKTHKNRKFLCDFCGKIYSSKRHFLLHRSWHRKKLTTKIDSFKCSNCAKFFRTKSNRKEHENYCLGKLPFECNQQNCDKKFASMTRLKNHIKLKHDKKFIVICSICNIGFVKVSDYKNHIVSHSADKKYACSKCNKNYKTLSNLNFHMKIHNKNLPYSCHICKKEFMRKEYLEAHINNHNGIKNFKCTYCEKKFVSQKNLDAHLKYHDGTVKRNSCNICGKILTTGFEEHLRIHNNLREFECEHCDMKFNTKGTLSKHVKKKHC